MKTLYYFFFALLLSPSLLANTYQYDDVRWYVGIGNDTAYLIIDLQEQAMFAPPTAFIWGILFTDSIVGDDALAQIAIADKNLEVIYSGGFIDSISYGNYGGKNGTNNSFWGVWSDTIGNQRWGVNNGGSTAIYPNDYFGLSFTDFNPAIVPDTAVAVNNPVAFTTNDLTYFTGTGADTSVLVIDFLNGNSFAWGYLFDGNVTASDMLTAIAADDDSLTVAVNTFLDDVIYQGNEGIAGMPNFWNTWSADNNGLWYANTGIGETILPGTWYGLSYTGFPPAIFPNTPADARRTITNTAEVRSSQTAVLTYPNPTSNTFTLNTDLPISGLSLITPLGEVKKLGNNKTVDLSRYAKGIYVLAGLTSNGDAFTTRIVKQ